MYMLMVIEDIDDENIENTDREGKIKEASIYEAVNSDQ